MTALPKFPTVQEWFTARELAELNLTSFAQTERGVQLLAKRNTWNDCAELSRRRSGRGGGFEYHIDLLPETARAELNQRNALTALSGPYDPAQEQVTDLQNISSNRNDNKARQAQMMQARAALLIEIERRQIVHELSRRQACLQLVSDLKLAGERLPTSDADHAHEADYVPLIEAAATAVDRKKGLSLRTLYGWFSLREAGGVQALAPKPKKKAAPVNAVPWFNDFLKFYARPSKPTVAQALSDYADSLQDPSEAPSYKQVRTALKKLGAIDVHKGREGAQTLKARLAYVSRNTNDLMPTSVYTADGKTFDAEIAHMLTGQPFRPELTSVLDVATRKCVGFSVSLKENCIAVADALRMASCEHGVPAIFYVDNGPGYKNKTLDADVTGMMGRLGISKMHSRAYNSQARGIIERFNGSVWNPLAKQLPTYVGVDMDREARKRTFQKTRKDVAEFGSSPVLMDWSEFLERCQQAVDAYNNRPHSSLPKCRDPETGRKRHMSPNESWAEHVKHGFEPVQVAPAEADELFRPNVIRTVRRCLIEWNTNTYFHMDLEAYHGSKVAIGIDVKDGSKIWVRELEKVDGEELQGRLICVAEFAGNETRYVPKSYEDAAIETRAKAQLRLIGNKADRVEQQLRSNLLLEATGEKPVEVLAPNMSVSGQQEALQIELAAVDVTAPKAPRKQVFKSDVELAVFAIEQPEKLTENQKKILRECLSRRTDLELFRLSSIDVDALRNALRAAA